MIKIGINGFGRIGRLVLRVAAQRDNVQVVAINDLLDVDYLAYMLKFDSVHGRFDGDIDIKNGKLIVNGKEIRVTSERNPEDLKWDEVDTDFVIDCTGIFKTLKRRSDIEKEVLKKLLSLHLQKMHLCLLWE